MWHPWREMRDIPGLVFGYRADLPSGDSWWIPSQNVILMRPGMLQVERRCALAHELGHRELEIDGCLPYADSDRHSRRDEANVDGWAARKLIEFDRLVHALRWSTTRAEAADELWVTEHLLTIRLDRLAPYEKHMMEIEGVKL